MVVALRRMFWVALLGGAGFAGWTIVQRRARALPVDATATDTTPRATQTAAPVRPADEPASPPPKRPDHLQFAGLPDDVTAPGESPTWLPPVDGACPAGYPVKANANSGIYHVPGGRFYERTIPERCYAHTADAEADGYRRAKA